MRKAYGYVRVSTEAQALEGVSLEAQRAKLRAWCEFNDCEIVDVFTDAGLSGGRADNRPALQAALDAVCKSGGVLVVYSLSRLARSTRDTITISERLAKAGADLVSVSEKIDTTSAAGKMMFRLMAVLAEFERDTIAERTKLGMEHKKSKGERVGAVPYGFCLGDDAVKLVTVEDEQVVIRRVVALHAQGVSLRGICAELELSRTPAKNGTRWHPKVLKGIIERSSELVG
jgi:DNA invertase Pin-like site-specific DNA recombinase